MKLHNTKKLLLLLFTIIAALCLAFGLSACDGNRNGSHTHTYSCYEFDENGHQLVCAESGKESEYESHTIVNGVCTACGVILEGSENLEYTLSSTPMQTYSVSGIGTCTDTNVLIPSFYNSLPVNAIASSAFSGCASITSVTIGNGVTEIGSSAFLDCTSLAIVIFSDSVITIYSTAFDNTAIYNDESNWQDGALYIDNCLITLEENISGSYTIKDGTRLISAETFYENHYLTAITIPDSVTVIGNSAFTSCDSLESITMGNNVTTIGGYSFEDTVYYNNTENWENGVLYIGEYLIDVERILSGDDYTVKDGTKVIADYAFSLCLTIKSVTLPDSVTTIGRYAFTGCGSLESITIGAGLKQIGDYAFNGYYLPISSGLRNISLRSVYYNGTAEEWNNISGVTESYIVYYGAPVYYYAESGSTTETGNYWYYDTDGSIKTWSVE